LTLLAGTADLRAPGEGMKPGRKRLADALGRVASGSESALAEVYDQTAAKLFGICLRILGNRSDAEDALQEVYINVWSKAGSFDPERASPITWLAALAETVRSTSCGRSEHVLTSRWKMPFKSPTPARGADASIESSQDSARLIGLHRSAGRRQSDAIRTAFSRASPTLNSPPARACLSPP
jgi:RNA polymerase sigma-70 factor (ECF subfamily)